MFQLFEESSNNHPKIFPHVLTHCAISYIIPSPTLTLAASNEQRPFFSCFLAAHMPHSNCSPGKDKSQLPIENPEIHCVHVYFIYRTGSYETTNSHTANAARHTFEGEFSAIQPLTQPEF